MIEKEETGNLILWQHAAAHADTISQGCPWGVFFCPILWDSHNIIIILIWNAIQLKLLNLWKFSTYKIGLHVQRDMQNDKIYWL